MSSEQLFDAMRPGSTSPLEKRDSKDLGRFGLGLKTASFSQARELTVVTRTRPSGPADVRRWDLDVVEASREWRLLRTAPSTLPVGEVEGRHGTTVVWSKCDRLVGRADVDDAKAQSRFNQVARTVADHLSRRH